MGKITFESTSTTSVMVREDGDFMGWLTKSTHKPTGLCAKRYTIFEGTIKGKPVRANTLMKCREIILA